MLKVVAISKEKEEKQGKGEMGGIISIMSTNQLLSEVNLCRIRKIMSTIPLIPPISGLDSLKTPLWGFFDDPPFFTYIPRSPDKKFFLISFSLKYQIN